MLDIRHRNAVRYQKQASRTVQFENYTGVVVLVRSDPAYEGLPFKQFKAFGMFIAADPEN